MLEKPLERLLFACRWLLAPLYLGLSLALLVLGIKFFQEAFHVIAQVTTLAEADQRRHAGLAVQARRRDAEAEGRGLDRRDFVDSPAADLHERAADGQ